MHNVALIANGQVHSLDQIRHLLLKYKRVVAVDGGLAYCSKMGIQPALIVGDFDSCPPDLLQQYEGIPKLSFSAEKDKTDLEIAILHEFQLGAQNLSLFGAWGHRIDHSLTNALLLTRYPGKIRLETENELLFAIDKKSKFASTPGQTLSLIPLNGPVTGIFTRGLKWELKDGKLDQNFIGISNICLEKEVEISIEQGSLVCSIQRIKEAAP